MSTKQNQLMQILKFIPCTYRVELSGKGGEIAIGRVSRAAYDYFEENNIDIDEFANDWDNELEVPEECQPFTPGEWHDCDDICHDTGMDISSGTLTVYDENNKIVLETATTPEALAMHGITLTAGEVFVVDKLLAAGDCFYVGESTEKGTFFDGGLELTAPFDANLLNLTYSNYNGWNLCSSVTYNSSIIDSDDYVTSGSGMYNVLSCVGDN